MEITFIGIGFEATLMLPMLERNIPAHYLGISSEPIDLEDYAGDKIRFCMRPSVDAAALRILPKIAKRIKDADIVFLLSEITGKSKEDIVCNIAEGLEGKTVVSIVWYPKQKHGQRGVSNTLERLYKCSVVVAIPHTKFTALLPLIAEYTEQILFMRKLKYVNAEPDTGKRILHANGLLHLVHREIPLDVLNLQNEKISWGMECIRYSDELDTVLDYGKAALLSLDVPQGTPPRVVQYICEYVFSYLGEDGEFNFSVTANPEKRDCVDISLIVADTATETEAGGWF